MEGDKHIFGNLRKVINLVDQLRDLGLSKYISLPRIAVLGSQSSGKSSLLEQIVGLDFLPRGSGVVTRRPLELRLVYQKDLQKPWGKFEELPGQEFRDFAVIKQTINQLTDKVAGAAKQIVDKPIILTVYSSTCPDLTLIDLPGITRISLDQQQKDIEKVTTEMATRYCKDPKTIIMCVTPGNSDISTSDGLNLARKLDPEGNRTIGVITKIDIMDKGTNAKRMLTGADIELKLGYVGIKNRSQQDIMDNKTVQQSLEEEKKFFSSHPVYSTLSGGLCGTTALTNKLTTVLYKHIRTFLPELLKEIRKQIEKNENRLGQLGTALPETDSAKLQFLWRVVNDFVSAYKSQLSGTYDKNAKFEKNQLPPGSKIRTILQDLYYDLTSNSALEQQFPVNEIQKAIQYHEGDSIPGFPSIDAFLAVISPRLRSLKEPANETIREVYECLEEVAVQILEKLLEKAPAVKEEIQESVIKHIQKQMQNTEGIVQDLIDAEINYIFTNNEQYLNQQAKKIDTGNPKDQQQQKMHSGNPMVNELKNRLVQYFKLVLRNVRDTIPKSIGFFLVKKTVDKMQMVLFEMIQRKDDFFKIMREPTHIVEERKEVRKAIKTLQEAEKIIKKDPDLSNYSKYDEEAKKPKQQVPPPKPAQQQPPSHSNSNNPANTSNNNNAGKPSNSGFKDLFGVDEKQQQGQGQQQQQQQQGQQQQQQQQNRPQQNNNNNPQQQGNNQARPNNMFPNNNNNNNAQNNNNNNNRAAQSNMFGPPSGQNTNSNNNLRPPQNNNQQQSQQQQRPPQQQQQQQQRPNPSPTNNQQSQNKPGSANNFSNQPQQGSGNNLNNNNPLAKPEKKKTGWLFN